jgi:hypothetical protein
MTDKFGDILRKSGYITDDQLQEALKIQAEGAEWIGQSMMRKKMISMEQLSEIITFQQSEIGKGKVFGVCAVGLGIITEKQRNDMFNYQMLTRGLIGEILANLGYLTDEQRDKAIKLQFSQM